MSTFSAEEISSLKSGGNERSNAMWMARTDKSFKYPEAAGMYGCQPTNQPNLRKRLRVRFVPEIEPARSSTGSF
jgi:hypothetical protein